MVEGNSLDLFFTAVFYLIKFYVLAPHTVEFFCMAADGARSHEMQALYKGQHVSSRTFKGVILVTFGPIDTISADIFKLYCHLRLRDVFGRFLWAWDCFYDVCSGLASSMAA